MKKLIVGALATAVALVGVGATAQAADASSSCYYSYRGCVHVRGYWTHSGTYVRPYVRNYPSYRYYRPSYSYRSYSYRPSYSYRYGW
jgi:hypothetical protein